MIHKRTPVYVMALALVALLLAACAVSTPEPTATPEPPAIQMAPDGSGDFATLHEAVEAAGEGLSIVLAAGTYVLDEPLEITTSLRLVGAGMDGTEIVYRGEGYVAHFAGEGPFGAEDITFRYDGGTGSDVVVVEGGEVSLVRCRFAGGEDASLRLDGQTTGTVRDSVAQGQRWSAGIEVEGEAQPALEGNEATGNNYGIRISEQAQPMLVSNVFRDNKAGGIRYEDSSGGTARDNDCSANGTGILVTGRAEPLLEGNTCNNNTETGFSFAGDAGGTARDNDCSLNFGGIGVSDRAQPTLEGNTCVENQTAGIAYFANAGGTARENEFARNGIHGIGLFGDASPTLEENICSDNGHTGINYADNTGGVATRNRCSDNLVGIYVAETAGPQLDNNDVRGNIEADLQDMRE